MRHGSARGHVPAGLYRKTALFNATAPVWRALARLESTVLGDVISETAIDRPIFVAGVPRSGTTIITEMLARHPEVTSHRYSDFPNVYTPYWRNWLADRTGRDTSAPVERAHRDRLKVNLESPEAVEEVIWMQFFEHLHAPERNQVLDASIENAAFEGFYREHIVKLLAVRGAGRYLAKGNYNATRLGYLLKLFPDARIVVPWREPVAQIASLVKQDRLFTQLSEEDPRVPIQLARSGHFEFGPGKHVVNVGDADQARAIETDWREGRLASGWARYWAEVYGSVLDFLDRNPELRQVTRIVSYESLCAAPGSEIDALLTHCELPAGPFDSVRAEYLETLSPPEYYQPEFSDAERRDIERYTHDARRRLDAQCPAADSDGMPGRESAAPVRKS